MGRFKNLTGQRFGKLTVVRPTGERQNGSVIWKCKCDCGKTVLVNAGNLKSSGTKSCGCLRQKDLTGQRFGKLTVVCPTGERQNGSVIWKCKCDCGKTVLVNAGNLKSGGTKSCGCLHQKDLTGQRFGKLTAIRPAGKRENGADIVWECICDCGKVALVINGNLKSGSTKSCGCLRKKKDLSKIEDYEDKVFRKIMDIHLEEVSKEILRDMAENPSDEPKPDINEFMKKVEDRQKALEEVK